MHSVLVARFSRGCYLWALASVTSGQKVVQTCLLVNSNVVEPWAVAHKNKINCGHCSPAVNVEAPDKMNYDCFSGADDTL